MELIAGHVALQQQQHHQQQHHQQQQQQQLGVENRTPIFAQQPSYNINAAFQPKHRDGPRAFASMSQLDVLMATPVRGRRSHEPPIEKSVMIQKL